MSGLEVRNIIIGQGIPKICVPVVANTQGEVAVQLEAVLKKSPDIIEFRADCFEGWSEDRLTDVLQYIRRTVGDIVLLFTLRTSKEGGNADISCDEYVSLCEKVCKSGLVDLIDVEAFLQDGVLAKVAECAHEHNVYVVASNHDFTATPESDELQRRLSYMDEMGADILKIAVMPNSTQDLMVLLNTTLMYSMVSEHKPLITMSMGEMGRLSRLTGEVFGSSVTFASVGKTSAPGQLPIDDVRQVLNIIHGDN